MKKLGVILFLAGLAAIVAVGCGSDVAKPAVVRVYASETCGVAPLAVEFRADATGGQRVGDPTGGNNFLHMRWDFGEGEGLQDGVATAYHTFATPDTYTVTVVAEDDDGSTSAPFTRTIVVLADTLAVSAYALVHGEQSSIVHPCEPVTFRIRASGCDFDAETGFYDRFLYTWTVDQPGQSAVYHGSRPVHAFAPSASGDYNVHLVLEDPSLSLTRRLTIPVTVVAGAGTSLALTGDWLDDAVVSPTIAIGVISAPDTLTYTVSVTCAGIDPAYGVHVHGQFPVNNRLVVLATEPPAGDELTYATHDSSGWEIRSFEWSIPFIDVSETRTAQVRVELQATNPNTTIDFYHRIRPYACDADTTDNRVRTRIQVGT